MKKVIVIGAGIAGLSCGIYAQQNGFDTEIYEMHTIPGGECTGWDRKGYYFDNCIHWLVGSKPGTGLRGVWQDTGALGEGVEVLNYEVFSRYEEGGQAVDMYTDTDRLEKHLMEIAPEDKAAIKKLCRDIRAMGNTEMPVAKPMDMMKLKDGLKMVSQMGKFKLLTKYGQMTMDELAGQFTSPLIRRAMLAGVTGESSAMALVSTLAGMNVGDCGYPMGGSRALALRMEKRYTELGGKVQYQSTVVHILVEDGKAVGIRLDDGTEVRADYVVSCSDAYATLMRMLDDKYTPDVYRNIFENPRKYPTYTGAMVYLGVDADVPGERMVTVRRKSPKELSGIKTESASLMNYSFEPVSAPEGKTVLAVFYGADYDYWNTLTEEQYEAEKERLTEDAVELLCERYPAAAGKIEVTDAVTPKTYERYCGAWRGSWMTWGAPAKDVPRYFPGVLDGLANFIMAGMWTMPPGGLPGSSVAGRFAAHRLCAWEGTEFKAGE